MKLLAKLRFETHKSNYLRNFSMHEDIFYVSYYKEWKTILGNKVKCYTVTLKITLSYI